MILIVTKPDLDEWSWFIYSKSNLVWILFWKNMFFYQINIILDFFNKQP